MPESTAPLLSSELLAKLEQLELHTRRSLRGRANGERRSPRKGRSVEFADFRNYAPGDDLRFIDWNLYARLDRLFLKLFLDEEDLQLHVLLDASPSMDFGEPTKALFAKRLGAALGVVGLQRGDRVSVRTLGAGINEAIGSFRGRGQIYRWLSHVASLETRADTPSLLEAARRFVATRPLAGLTVLVSDLLDRHGYEAAIRALAARRGELFVIHVLSREELEPHLRGDLRLVDSEDGQEREVTLTPSLLARYRRTLAAFIGQAREFCVRHGVTYVSVASDEPIELMMLEVLRRRGLLR